MSKAANTIQSNPDIWPKPLMTPAGRKVLDWRTDASDAVLKKLPARIQCLFDELSPNADLLRTEAEKLLGLAACYEFPAGLDIILSRPGVKPDQIVTGGMTGLHIAAALGREEGCMRLIENGVHADVRTAIGITPLMVACMRAEVGTLTSSPA